MPTLETIAPEIRLRIYRLLVTTTEIEIAAAQRANPFDFPPILSVCKLIHHEVAPLVAAATHLILKKSTVQNGVLQKLPKWFLNHLTHLSLSSQDSGAFLDLIDSRSHQCPSIRLHALAHIRLVEPNRKVMYRYMPFWMRVLPSGFLQMYMLEEGVQAFMMKVARSTRGRRRLIEILRQARGELEFVVEVNWKNRFTKNKDIRVSETSPISIFSNYDRPSSISGVNVSLSRRERGIPCRGKRSSQISTECSISEIVI